MSIWTHCTHNRWWTRNNCISMILEKNIRVWIWSLAIKDGKLLYWLRKSQHWEWTCSPPWGHLEFWETIEQCAVRELFEESWLIAEERDVIIFCTMNEIYPCGEKHYINIIALIPKFSWTLENKEPDKLEKWEWMSWEDIKNLWGKNFLPMQNLIELYPNFDPSNI